MRLLFGSHLSGSLLRASVLCLAAGLLLTTRLPAAEGLKPADTALKFLPDSVIFYSSSLRIGEQMQAVARSNAWKKFTQMPAVQMGLGLYQLQTALPDTPVARFNALLTDTQWETTRALVRDMFAQEVFCCGDKDILGMLRLVQEIQRTVQFGPALARLSNPNLPADDGKLQAKLLMATLLEKADAIKTPGFLMGFRLQNPQRAVAELARLEQALQPLLGLVPQVKDRLQRTKIGKFEYLTLALDGRMIPWELVPQEQLAEFENNPGDAKRLFDRLKNLKLVIALGVRENYLLASIGSSTATLAKLGTGKRLLDRPEFAPLTKFADRRLAGVGYVSAAFAAMASNPQDGINSLLQMLEQALPAAKLTKAQQNRIAKDAAQLAEELLEFVPEPVGMSEFSFLTAGGCEGYRYHWGIPAQLDGSRPLSLLDHVGGAPLAAFVLRGKSSPKQYEVLVKWLPVALNYAEEIGLAKEDNAQQQTKIKQLAALLRKTGAQLDQINRTTLLPALADGQAGFVLDAKLRSKQFFAQMPPAEKPLPMFEPALVIGVSDRQKLREAVVAYAALANDFWAELRKITLNELPAFTIPQPKSVTGKEGDVFYYALPGAWGLDKQLLPNVGLGAHAAVFSLNRKHTERLLAATPWKGGTLPASAQQPLAAAGCCRWADTVDAVAPWIDYGVKLAVDSNPQMAENKAQVKYVMDQVHTFIELLKVFKGASSESYQEQKAIVEHWRAEFEDVK